MRDGRAPSAQGILQAKAGSSAVGVAAVGGFSGAGAGVDAALVARIRRAYRAAVAGWRGAGDSMWAEIGVRNAPVHAALMEEDGRLAEVLRDPGRFDLLYGFHSLFAERTDALRAAEEGARQAVATALAGELWRLCEAVGARWLRNPEAAGQAPQDAEVEGMLDALDVALRIRIEFPTPWPDEFGLVTSRGVASYRAVHALYQAYRLRALAGASGRVLEIGAGLGRTAYYARRMGISDYTIVDLPMTNVAQAGFLGTVLGSGGVRLFDEAAGGGIRILSPEWLHASGRRSTWC